MPSHRMGRTTEDIRRELTAIFRELKDPRVQGLISIVRVDVSSDLSYCTVYISAMEGMEHAKQATQGLKSASGYIRRELGQRLRLRHVPEMHFKATDSIEYSANISKILNDLPLPRRTDRRKNPNQPPGEPRGNAGRRGRARGPKGPRPGIPLGFPGGDSQKSPARPRFRRSTRFWLWGTGAKQAGRTTPGRKGSPAAACGQEREEF